MIYKVVAIRDRAADVFGQPQLVPTTGTAIRSFSDAVNTSETGALQKHPEDFDLYLLAEYDDATGQFANVDPPRMLAVGKDVRAKS